MSLKQIALLPLLAWCISSCAGKREEETAETVIANGQMPAMAMDNNEVLHLVFGASDSILYTTSTNNGTTFSAPALLSVLPHIYASSTRGPQVAATKNGVVVTACTATGNIYSFHKENNQGWSAGTRINDADTSAKEGLMDIDADGDNVYAVWLDMRGNHQNKIYGAASADGGNTWSANQLVYASPDSTVCECCKPSVVVSGKNVYVMFRNQMNGNRDMYLIRSSDGGNTFATAQKLGNGSWKLNGCPMDGGGLAVLNNGEIQTVWRRHNNIYRSSTNGPGQLIGEGKNCTLEVAENRPVYAWTENGDVVFLNPKGEKQILGKGSLPVLQALPNHQLICAWHLNKQIHAAVIDLR